MSSDNTIILKLGHVFHLMSNSRFKSIVFSIFLFVICLLTFVLFNSKQRDYFLNNYSKLPYFISIDSYEILGKSRCAINLPFFAFQGYISNVDSNLILTDNFIFATKEIKFLDFSYKGISNSQLIELVPEFQKLKAKTLNGISLFEYYPLAPDNNKVEKITYYFSFKNGLDSMSISKNDTSIFDSKKYEIL